MKSKSITLIILTTIFLISLNLSEASAQLNYKGGNLIVEAGGMVGVQKFKMGGGSIGVIGGHTFNEHLFVGGGMTVNYYQIDSFDALSVPLFGRIKYTLFKWKITPFISADIGFDPFFIYACYDTDYEYGPQYGDNSVNEIRGGLYIHPEVGVSYRLHKRKSINFALGCKKQRGTFRRYEWDPEGDLYPKTWDALYALTFRVGFMC